MSALRSEGGKNQTDVKVNFHSRCLQGALFKWLRLLSFFKLLSKVHCRGDASVCSTIKGRYNLSIFQSEDPCQDPLNNRHPSSRSQSLSSSVLHKSTLRRIITGSISFHHGENAELCQIRSMCILPPSFCD